ncbi:MAG: hypothetical protein V1701_05095 [Planctomycetota bacterium]
MTDHLKPLEVTTSKIGTGAVTESKIAKEAVGSANIKEGAVTTPKIGELQVISSKLQNASVTALKIADGAVTVSKIAPNAVTADKIASGAVTRDKISDGVISRPFSPPITTAEIGDNQVTGAKLQGLSVTTEKIADGAVTGAKIAQNTITQGDLAANAVGSSELQDGVVITAKLAVGAVSADRLAGGAVTPTKLAAVDSPADGEVPTYNAGAARFEWRVVSGGGITRPITPGVTGDEITDQAVTETKIANSAVTSGKIQDSSVKPSKLASANAPSNGAVLAYNEPGSNFQWQPLPPTAGLTLLQSQTQVFTEQSANNVDQLVDLPPFIPPVAKAVILEIQFNAMSVPLGLEQQLWVYGRRGGADWGSSTIHFIWQNLANLNNNFYKESIAAIDANRQIRVIANKNGQFCSINIWLRGYVE